jgi:hypothetical protein
MNLKRLCSQAIEFKIDALGVLRGPGVYLFVRGDVAVYCESSKKVVGRILARNHHEINHLMEADSLLIFPCRDHNDAKKLESEIIALLMPKHNQRNCKAAIARDFSGTFGMTDSAFIRAYL